MVDDVPVQLDTEGRADLCGVWDFFPGAHGLEDLSRLEAVPIEVPGLWEAQGHLRLDGAAWYRRRFVLDDPSGHWTLHFGAVMDTCEVHVNGRLLGTSDLPFTPFELDPGGALLAGGNELAVLVVDPSESDPQHRRLPHGKQGWANGVFPSPPSLYLTYGGIWQPVTLRRHGPVVVTDVFANGDPRDLRVQLEVENRSGTAEIQVEVRTLGALHETSVRVNEGCRHGLQVDLGAVEADWWHPDRPALHTASVAVRAEGVPSDRREVRFGLRTVEVEGRRLLFNGEPYRMKSALVQGFRADRLYAEGTVEQIRDEVAAAKAMGFNTLRLHVKAFDPAYLDVCDELGMLLHCDLPVAEPVERGQLGAGTELVRRCVAAARAQVRRDRNHPSIVLWSAMNELGEGDPEVRRSVGYEEFARAVAGAVTEEDPTRPVIENDWMEPDPERVFTSEILTAHWYGRLHRGYLRWLDAACRQWSGLDRPLLVTELGDWGLPDLSAVDPPPFWDVAALYSHAVAATRWPGSLNELVGGTQRYQGLADRLQIEVLRRYDHIGGYCVTELTDVPHELNGLLDLERRPKTAAAAELVRANQVVLPMLDLDSWVVQAGTPLRAPLHVANDGPALDDVSVDARLGTAPPAPVTEVGVGSLAAASATVAGELCVEVPDVPGSHELVLRVRRRGSTIAENRYPIHVVDASPTQARVRLLGAPDRLTATSAALAAAGAVVEPGGVTVVAEDGLDRGAASEVVAALAAGCPVVVLAQPVSAAPHYPLPVVLGEHGTGWGPTPFRFTTGSDAIPSLPRRRVLVTEDATIHPAAVVTRFGNEPLPRWPVVVSFRPPPALSAGTVVGAHGVDRGRLVVCQYRLVEPAASADAAALAILGDLLTWAASDEPEMVAEDVVRSDGRRLTRYSWPNGSGR